jgi:RNA polymerase sigma-70 factor (ECF subfamily)
VALTLRTVGGLATADVARAFLVSEATMTRRLTRARTKIEEAGIPFGVPADPWRPERLQGVLGVLYLLFNRGYDAGPAEPHQAVLATEAIRLARLLVDLAPREPEARGVLGLMLLTQARRPARFVDGTLVSLEFQDRSLWERQAVEEGLELVDQAFLAATPGPYTLQAAIAACHARAPQASQTDFGRIAGLYARLEAVSPSPVVRLNLAVARGLAEGPRVGLALADALAGEPALARYHLLPAVRADFLGRLGRHEEAIRAYEQAEALAPTEADRRFLADKRRQLTT